MGAENQESERVGVVLVHGIGEQKRFEHLTGEALQLIRALQADPGVARVSVHPRSVQDAHFAAEHEFWRAEGEAPVRIDVLWKDRARKPTSFFLHEVWWADLDDKITLWNQVRFWFWALGLWGVKHFSRSTLPGFAKYMDLPRFPPGRAERREWLVRFRLWFAGVVFLMAMGSVGLLNYLLRRLHAGQLPGADVFYRYLGDVKLYQDRKRAGEGALTDVGEPPRVAIRRRMIRVLVDVWQADYDRWYLLAHSLGTVLGWNGLMESAHALPNYLDQETWKRIQGTNLVTHLGDPGPVGAMRPARPVWITDDSLALDRKVLFTKLRGFVTYGSPLDKFAYLWGAIVPINRDKDVFPSDFEWINVFAHTDPVAAELNAYTDAIETPKASFTPKNYAYKSHSVLLLSHLRYLKFKVEKEDCFVRRLVGWMSNPEQSFPAPTERDPSWDPDTSPRKGFAIRAVWWVAAVVIMAQIIVGLTLPALQGLVDALADWGAECVPCIETAAAGAPEASSSLGEWLWPTLGQLLGGTTAVFLTAAAIVTTVGLLRGGYELRLDRGTESERR
ncbi:MAG TPA: hypothetical protein VNL74_01840 [Methylococcus sp.]|nr:hypothetical protein [Methylococcus sp.]